MTFVVKVPGVNGLGKTKGTRNAGNAVLNELNSINYNEQGNVINSKLLDIEEIHVDNNNLEEAEGLIYENSLEMFETKNKIIFLGGDHSISYSTGRAFLYYCNKNRKDAKLIVFDAHADVITPKGHEIMPSHKEWLRTLIEKGFKPSNILLVGIRNLDSTESIFLKENKIRVIQMNQFLNDLEDTCDIIMEFANLNNKESEVYLSLDIDVIDPAFAPSTRYAEPGGLTSREFLYIIQRLNRVRNLKAIDLVEINSEEDKTLNNITLKLGAKILAELI